MTTMNLNRSFAIVVIAIFAALSFVFTSCEDNSNLGPKKVVEGDTIINNALVQERWNEKSRNENGFIFTVNYEAYCLEGKSEVSEDDIPSDKDNFDIYGKVITSGSNIVLLNENGELVFSKGKAETFENGMKVTTSTPYANNNFSIDVECSGQYSSLFTCSKEVEKFAGISGTLSGRVTNENVGDTVIGNNKFDFLRGYADVNFSSSYKREYDRSLSIPVRIKVPAGTVIVTYDKGETTSFEDACSGSFVWGAKFWNSTDSKVKELNLSVTHKYVREAKIEGLPASFTRENGDAAVVNLTATANGTATLVSNLCGSNDSISWEVSRQNYNITDGKGLSCTAYINYTSKLTWKKSNATIVANVPAPSAAQALATIAQTSTKVDGFTNRNVTVNFGAKMGNCEVNAPAVNTVMKEKDKVENRTYKVLNNRVTAVSKATWTYISSFDYVTYLNGEVESTKPYTKTINWKGEGPADVRILVQDFDVTSTPASWIGNAYTKKTNKVNFAYNFTIGEASETLPGVGTVKYASLKDILVMADNGVNNPLETISDLERGLRSTITASALDMTLTLSGYAVLYKKAEDKSFDDMSKFGGPTIGWHYNARTEGYVDVFTDFDETYAYTYIKGELKAKTLRSEMRELVGAVGAYQAPNGEWIPAEARKVSGGYAYFSYCTAKGGTMNFIDYNNPNQVIQDKFMMEAWNGTLWSGFQTAKTVKNVDGTTFVDYQIDLKSTDNNKKGEVKRSFTIKADHSGLVK